MDERTRLMIETHIPGEPDASLGMDEYYYLQCTRGGERVIRVQLMDILCQHDCTEYGVYQRHGGGWVRVDAGYGTPDRGVRMHDLYDNRDDCRAQTHMTCDNWKTLRAAQRAEGLTNPDQ